jgi:hypothetical protein
MAPSRLAIVFLVLATPGFASSSLFLPGPNQSSGITEFFDPTNFFQSGKVVSTETFDEFPTRPF